MNRPMLYALIVSSLSILIFGYLIFRFTVHLDPQNLTAAEAAGKSVWERHGCVECHAVFGNGGYSAPELTQVYNQRGAEWLIHFFRYPPVKRPTKALRHLALPAEDIPSIVAYLRLISRIQLSDWPPRPLFPVPAGEDS